MQRDMHYYATYSIARSAGLKPKDARTLAYAAEYVDDAIWGSGVEHPDGGFIYEIATAHHPNQALKSYILHGKTGQRQMWIPFHFYPGNEGDTISERLLCRKNSCLANEMFDNHLAQVDQPYTLHLMGIASHVYCDTFSHYGFSGMSSRENKVDQSTFKFYVNGKEQKNDSDLEDHLKKFFKKYKKEFNRRNWRCKRQGLVGSIAEKFPAMAGLFSSMTTGALGHGPAGVCPDLPFLEWSFHYEKGNRFSGIRNNPKTYFEACAELHKKLNNFAKNYYQDESLNSHLFSKIQDTVKALVSYRSSVEGGATERAEQWKQAVNENKLFNKSEKEYLEYDLKEWELQNTKVFPQLEHSSEAKDLDIYKFYQAAAYHRYYTLKQLLPKYGLIVN